MAAFDIQILYRSDMHQVTIRAALTDDTPRTITALLDDPRTDSDTASIAPGQDPVYHSAPAPMGGAVTLNHRAGQGSLPRRRGLGPRRHDSRWASVRAGCLGRMGRLGRLGRLGRARCRGGS